MRKMVLAAWMVVTLVVTLAYAAVQGDFVINGVDASTSTKFYRIPASIANGLRVDVTRVSAGTKTPADAFANPSDAITTWTLNAGYNGATWDMFRSGGNNADGVATATLGLQRTVNYLYGWNASTWDRVHTGAVTADGITANTTGNVSSRTFGYVYNGSSWDRVRGNATDGVQVYNGRWSTTAVSTYWGTTSSTTLAAANASRRMVHIYNEGASILYVKLGTGATTTSYSFKLQPESYWEMPVTTYSGIITGVWSGTTATTMVTTY